MVMTATPSLPISIVTRTAAIGSRRGSRTQSPPTSLLGLPPTGLKVEPQTRSRAINKEKQERESLRTRLKCGRPAILIGPPDDGTVHLEKELIKLQFLRGIELLDQILGHVDGTGQRKVRLENVMGTKHFSRGVSRTPQRNTMAQDRSRPCNDIVCTFQRCR